jgi:hypothetical protein
VRTRLLIVGASVMVMVLAYLVLVVVDRLSGDEVSDDCRQTERALQPWAATMPQVHRNLPPDIAFPTDGDDPRPDYAAAAAREAQAANDIRAQAAFVESPALRRKLYEVADAFDVLSRSRSNTSSPTAPTNDYFSATSRMTAALYDIKKACPTVGEETPVNS